MGFCSIVGCSKRYKKGEQLSFYRLPTIIKHQGPRELDLSRRRRMKWIANISRKNMPKTVRVCGRHFISGKPAELHEATHPDWAPTLELGHNLRVSKDANNRNQRCVNREKKKKNDMEISKAVEKDDENNNSNEGSKSDQCNDELNQDIAFATEAQGMNVEIQPECNTTSNATQTDTSFKDLDALTADNIRLREELRTVQNFQKKTGVSTRDCYNDDQKVKFYTGLCTKDLLFATLDYLIPSVKNSLLLSAESKILLVLLRLRLNLALKDLGFKFGISTSTASRTFSTTILLLNKMLSHLILWPEREDLWATMPKCFCESFGNKVVVIMDCFEIQIEKPSNLCAQASTWSNYKQRNTVKYLIGIAPQGVITFISKGFGGRASDKTITEQCGILKNLLPGDLVLADRGFRIGESVALYQASLALPAFVKNKEHQLEAIDVQNTRKIANVRIHVERVIGVLRQRFRMLLGCLEISNVQKLNGESQIDCIVRVCCALNNLNPSVVPNQ